VTFYAQEKQMSNTCPRYVDLYDSKTGLKRKLDDFIIRMRENPFSSEYTDQRLYEIWELAEDKLVLDK
jgi:hypothetical protein